MKLLVLAVGQRLPAWADAAYADYAKRFAGDTQLETKSIKAESRSAGKTAAQCISAEQTRIEQAIAVASKTHKNCYTVVLDERGERLRTLDLAAKLTAWQNTSDCVALVVGGPDGLAENFRAQARERIRLSDLTLPHALARVLLVEQLYRAWAINHNHPYHRE